MKNALNTGKIKTYLLKSMVKRSKITKQAFALIEVYIVKYIEKEGDLMKRKNKKSFNWYGLRQRFSIRKYHFGAASVLIGTTMFLMGGPTTQAAETGTQIVQSTDSSSTGKAAEDVTNKQAETPAEDATNKQVESQTENTSNKQDEAKANSSSSSTSTPEVTAKEKVDTTSNGSNEVITQPKAENQEEKAQEEKSTATVSTDALRTYLDELKNLLKEVPDSLKEKVENQEKVAEKTEKLLDSETSTQQEVDEQVAFVRISINSLKKLKENNWGLDSKDKAEDKSEKETRNPKERSANITPKEKLEKLSQNLNAYFKFASEITRPETKELIKGTEDIIRSVNEGLQQPDLTDEKIQSLIEQGKQAERKLALAVTRENSGKRDLLTGKPMKLGSDFRAAPEVLNTKRAYIVKKDDGSGLPAETYLYAMKRGQNEQPTENNLAPVNDAVNEAKITVTNLGNGDFRWDLTFNAITTKTREHQNAFYWFTLPKGHTITETLGVTRTHGGHTNSFVGGRGTFNQEWGGKIKETITAGHATYGPASGKDGGFNTNFASINDVTDTDFIAKSGTSQRTDTPPTNNKSAGGYYYLGPTVNRFKQWPSSTAVSGEIVDRSKKVLEGLKQNTDLLYHFTLSEGKIQLSYKTHTETPYAPIYYGAGMRSLENNEALMYFMARGLQEKPNAPTVTPNNEGTVTVTPYPDNDKNKNVDKVELSYTNNGAKKTVTLTRNPQNGTWTSSGDGADGIQINGNSFSLKAGSVQVGTEVKAKSYFGNSDASDERTERIRQRTATPTVTANQDGSVTVTPNGNANSLTVKYIEESNSQKTEITANKQGSTWTVTGGTNVTIDQSRGIVTIPANSVKDRSEVEAQAKATDEFVSATATATAKDQDRTAPTIRVRKNGTNTWLTPDSTGKVVVVATPDRNNVEIDVDIKDEANGSGYEFSSNGTNPTATKTVENSTDYNENSTTYSAYGKAADATAKLRVGLKAGKTTTDFSGITMKLNAKDKAGNATNATNKKEVTVKIVSAKPTYPPRVKVLNPTNIQETEKDTILTAIKEANKTNEANPTFTKESDGIKATYTDGTTYKVPYSEIVTYNYRATKKTINVGENPNWGSPKQYFTYEDGGAIGDDKTFLWKGSSTPMTAPNNPDLTVGTNKTVEVLAPDPEGGDPKTLTLTYDVVDTKPPKVKINGTELGENVDQNPRFVIYRGAEFNPTFEVEDNSGKTTYLKASDIPSGVWFNKQQNGHDVEKTDMANNTRYTLTTNNIVDNNNTLGEHTASVTVKDASRNEKTYQFKYVIVDIEARNTPETVPLNTKLVDPADKDHAKDSHNYVKVSDGNTQKPDGDDDYYTTGMSFTWSKNNTPITNKTLLSTPGIVEYTAVVTFPNNGAKYSTTVDGKTVTVYPPKKDTAPVTFRVKPTAPTVTPATNGDVTVTPANETNVNKVEVTYTPADTNRLEDNGTVTKTAQDRTMVIATKGSNNQWSITSGAKEGISVNTTTGEITLKDQVVKDQTKIQAKVVAQEVPSDENGNSDSKDGDRTNPTIGLGNTLVGVGKEINLSLGLSDNGVGIDDSNIKVTLPAGASGLRYDTRTKSITGTLSSAAKHEVKVTVLDKNGNKAEKTISIAAVKPKPIYAIKDGTINNVDTPSHFVEVPAGVTNPSVAWKNGKPTTTAAGTTNKAVTVSATGYTSTEVDVPVKVYDKVTLKKGTYANALGRLKNGKNANDYVNGVAQGVTVKWKNNQIPDVSQANPNLKGYIEVSYATDDAEHPIKETLEVNLPTYSATLTHTSYETTVGTPFERSDSRTDFFTYASPPSRLDKVHSVWEKTSAGNYSNYASSKRTDNSGVIGEVTDRIRVYYPEYDGSDEWNDKRSEDLAPITFTVKPQAPTINSDDFRGKASTKPTATVGNLPTAGQLGTDARVTVELYQGTNKVASKAVTKGTTSVSFNSGDYTANLIAGQEVHAVVKVEGTTDKKAYDLSSANSSTARVTTTAPEKPKISQNPEDLVVNATVGQGNSTNATLTYYDSDNQAQNVNFTKTGNNWAKSENNNTNITITNAGVIELKAGVAKAGTSVSVKQRTETSEYSEPATEKVLGRLNGLTNTPKADGSVEIIVPPTASHMTLTYTPQGQTTPKTLEYTKTGTTWTTHTETNTYSGEHKIVIPKENVADGTKVSAIASNDDSTTTTVVSKAKFEQPNATTSNQRDNGDVRITLPDNADTVTVTYTDKQNAAKSVTLTKGAGNQWTSGGNLPNDVTLTGSVLEIPYKIINNDENIVRTASTRGEEDVRSQEATQEITADHRPPTTQAVVIAAGATPTNEDLSRGVTVDKRSVTAKSPLAAIAAGTITEVPATLTYNDGSTEDITLTVKSKPTAPTFNNLENHGTFSGLSSASKEISGTAMAGAEKVKLTLQDGSVKEIIPNADGSWSYTLGATEYLTQNFSGVNNRVFDEHTVKAVQVKNGIESEEATANVAPGQATIDDVYKAGRAITVNIPHDVEAGYVRVNGIDYGIQKVDGTWKVISSASNATKLEISSAVVDPNNKAVTKVTFKIKDANLNNPPFTIGDNKVGFRTHYSKDGRIGVPTPGIQGTDGWAYSAVPINTKPTVELTKENGTQNPKLKDNHVFASPTVDELKDYIAGADKEDDANLTVGLGASDRSKFRIRVFTKDTN